MRAAIIRSRNKITLVGRVQGGIIEGWGGQDVRMTDLFFKGGETIRGFERAGIGPRDACEEPHHGQARQTLLQGSSRRPGLLGGDRRSPLPASRSFPTISACRARSLSMPDRCGCRADLPSSQWPRKNSFINDGPDVRLSTGVSLIWQSPLGPLRADLAQALLKASYDRTEIFRFGASTAF